ncbi:MAG: rhodanese-like domain-containing protein [Planctomycetaceae bacterium]
MLLACGTSRIRAAETTQPQPLGNERRIIPGYCGLYCLHAAFQALGHQTEFASLVMPRYLGSHRGSSAAELSLAATEHGMQSRLLTNLTCGMLPLIDVPVLLHVRSKPSATEYDHWILLLGVTSGNARIYDGAGHTKLIPMQRLAAVWDGVGLFVSNQPIDLTPLYLYAAECLVAIASVILIINRFWRPNNRDKIAPGIPRNLTQRIFGELCSLAVLVIAIIGAVFLVSPGGYLSDQEAIAAVQERHIADLVPHVSYEVLQSELSTGQILLIDARHQRDFEAGHLPNAINFPADKTATEARLCEMFARFPKTTPVVIYCQSEGCNFDEYVGRLFHSAGFSNLRFFVGGWSEWQAKQASPW